MKRVFSTLLSALTALTAVSCYRTWQGDNTDEEASDGISECDYAGKTYVFGDTFAAEDGCNRCTCEDDGAARCTADTCALQCEYDGKLYAPGETFDATDGCNSCTCGDDGAAVCSLNACEVVCYGPNGLFHPGDIVPREDRCEICICLEDGAVQCEGLPYVEPGCPSEPWMPVFEAGCYDICSRGTHCRTGTCQLAGVNRCDDGVDATSCDDCTSYIWVCLDAPDHCTASETVSAAGIYPRITGGGRSHPTCRPYCKDCDPWCWYSLSFESSEDQGCTRFLFSACFWDLNTFCIRGEGTLTPKGEAEALGLAAELEGSNLRTGYGCGGCEDLSTCPECEGVDISSLYITVNNEEMLISYDSDDPPSNLLRADAFVQDIIEAVTHCDVQGDDDIILSACY